MEFEQENKGKQGTYLVKKEGVGEKHKKEVLGELLWNSVWEEWGEET